MNSCIRYLERHVGESLSEIVRLQTVPVVEMFAYEYRHLDRNYTRTPDHVTDNSQLLISQWQYQVNFFSLCGNSTLKLNSSETAEQELRQKLVSYFLVRKRPSNIQTKSIEPTSSGENVSVDEGRQIQRNFMKIAGQLIHSSYVLTGQHSRHESSEHEEEEREVEEPGVVVSLLGLIANVEIQQTDEDADCDV
jgi:hypothetical protein